MMGVTLNVGATDEKVRAMSFPVGVLPPSTQASASLFPNSKTWNATEGVYLVAAMNNTENPYFTPTPGISGMISPTSAVAMEDGVGWVGYLPRLRAGELADNLDYSACTTVWPWDVSGCVFSGLNEFSTLQVTVRYYIERHPSIAEPDLLVLARTPCPYDPTVQEIYARAMHELPVGVPVGMNPLGEWFNEVLDAVATWAPQVGSALGNIIPGASMVGNAFGMGAKAWRNTRKNELAALKPPKGGKAVQKIKTDKKGRVKEIDTTVTSKKKKYTKAEKRAYKARKLVAAVATARRKAGPKRRPPTNARAILKQRSHIKL
jgi:hypothetical protein